MTAKKNGITKEEIVAIITHAAFYAGWPMEWAVFNMAKEVWADNEPVSVLPQQDTPRDGRQMKKSGSFRTARF